MNKIIIFICLACVFTVYAQNIRQSEVPQAVKDKLAAMYPKASKIGWEMENGKYEAEFRDVTVETSVIFNPDGTYIQTETEIPVNSLPSGVNTYKEQYMPDKKINEASKITDNTGTISYEAEIGKDDYIFDVNGNFLRTENDSSETEDNDK